MRGCTTSGTGRSGRSSPWSCRRVDNSITTYTKGRRLGRRRLTSKTGPRRAEPDLDPGRPTRRYGGWPESMSGTPGGSIGEPFNLPMTAHFIGGCTIGDSPDTGVVDPYHRVYGYPGLHIVDGSAISANLGRQPVADDHRPGRAGDGVCGRTRGRPTSARRSGAAYQRLGPVVPKNPVVPEHAPGALRLPHRRSPLTNESVRRSVTCPTRWSPAVGYRLLSVNARESNTAC